MPIQSKPGALRARILAAIGDYADVFALDGLTVEILTDAAMRALAAYDKPHHDAAAAGEPTFTLRAQDRLACMTVSHWAADLASHPEHREVREAKARDALRIADAMRAWPNRKLPD